MLDINIRIACPSFTKHCARECVLLVLAFVLVAGQVHSLNKTQLTQLRIAIVNGVPFHMDLVAGLLHVLAPYEKNLDVFLHSTVISSNLDGSRDLVRGSNARFFRAEIKRSRIEQYDMAVLVSPDYELEANQQILTYIKPKLTVAIVHNSDFRRLQHILELHEHLELVTLSPHVANTLAASTATAVSWMLPSYPFQPSAPCVKASSQQLKGPECFSGFSVQGKFSNLRRNYSRIWDQTIKHIHEIKQTKSSQLFQLHIMGKGAPHRLNIPPLLKKYVRVHWQLPYLEYYEQIYKTLALIPALGSPKYYRTKFSSTALTSLTTGTPLIVNEDFLQAYSFITPETAWLQQKGAEELDTMLWILQRTPSEVLKLRQRLQNLRTTLNQRSLELLESFMARACNLTLAKA